MNRTLQIKDGVMDVYKLLPNVGDSVMITNCGDHYEMRQHQFDNIVPAVALTEQDIKHLKAGKIDWN